MNLGPTELLIVVAIILPSYVIPIWAIVDAARASEADFAAIGSSKTTQIIVLVVSALLCGFIGLIISVVYLLTTRRQLRALATI